MAEEKSGPWLRGIVDTLVGAEVLRASAIPHRNRLAVILIDSAFETACRAYLQHRAKVQLADSHRHRPNLISTIKSKLTQIDEGVWDNINFYYEEIRCDFYHESAGKTITDTTLLDYRDTVEFVIDQAFETSVRLLVEAQLQQMTAEAVGAAKSADDHSIVHVSDVAGRVNKVVVAVARVSPKRVEELNEFFKREGEGLRLKSAEFGNIVSRNDGSKKFFYFDRDEKRWKLSGLGRFRLNQLKGGKAHE